MPVFDTPKPISVTLDLRAGDVRITASERSDTVVEVRPTNRHDDVAVQVADGAHVDLDDGKLTISMPPPRRRGLRDMFRAGTVEVTIELPVGSHIRGTVAGEFRGIGRLGECRLRTDYGDIRLDETGPLHALTSSGEIDVDRAVGCVDLASQHGEIRIRTVDGPATIKNVDGEIAVGEVTGDLRLTGVNGEIAVDRALGNVAARTAYGGVRIGQVVRGSVVLTTASGEFDVGIARGTAAWLELDSASGEVHNLLDAADGPDPSDETVEVRARTSDGDIHIRRS